MSLMSYLWICYDINQWCYDLKIRMPQITISPFSVQKFNQT